MPTPFNLPPLGENIEAGTVVSVMVSVGDTIEIDQGVLEIETDKATLEVPSNVSGIVKEILIQEGDQAEVGKPVLTIEAGAAEEEAPAKTPAPPEEPVVEESAPEPEASEATPVAAPAPVVESAPQTAAPASSVPAPNSNTLVPAAPSVRRFAREIGIDMQQVSGSGPGGRISIEDVKAYAKKLNTGAVAAPVASGQMPGIVLPDFSKWGEVEREKMSNLRRTAAERLTSAWVNIPHVTYADKADITNLEKLRKQYGPRAEAAGGKLTMTAIALKFAVAALKRFPLFNASIDMVNQEVIHKKYYHIGVAVDTDRGLVVPVIRDVDQKNVIELAVELSEIAVKARNKKLSVDDMQGSTFTITNLGGFGGTSFTPIINAPDVAILGLARGRIEPVYIDGEFQPRLMVPLMISYDHRIIDGADGARFMKWLIEAFEQPFLLSLEG